MQLWNHLANTLSAWWAIIYSSVRWSTSVRKSKFVEKVEKIVQLYNHGNYGWLPEKVLYALYYEARSAPADFYLLPSAKHIQQISLNKLFQLYLHPNKQTAFIHSMRGLFWLKQDRTFTHVQDSENQLSFLDMFHSADKMFIIFHGTCKKEIFLIENTFVYIPIDSDYTVDLTSRDLDRATLSYLAKYSRIFENVYQNGNRINHIEEIDLTKPFSCTSNLLVVPYRHKLRVSYTPK